MEHRRPNGDLMSGYYCGTCGQPTSMYGHGGQCTPDATLVKQLSLANPPDGVKPVYRRKGVIKDLT